MGVAMRIVCTSLGRISGVKTLRPASPIYSFRRSYPLSSLLRSMITFRSAAVAVTGPRIIFVCKVRHLPRYFSTSTR